MYKYSIIYVQLSIDLLILRKIVNEWSYDFRKVTLVTVWLGFHGYKEYSWEAQRITISFDW